MKFNLAAIVISFISWHLQAQSNDSLSLKLKSFDNLTYKHEMQLDSIRQSAEAGYSKLTFSFDSLKTATTDSSRKIQSRIDSLTNLGQPTGELTEKLDSLNRWQTEKLEALTKKMNDLKANAKAEIESFSFPPELEKKAADVTSAIEKLNVSLPDGNISGLSLPGALSSELPGIENPLAGQPLPDITSANIPSVDPGGLANEVGDVQQKLGTFPSSVEELGETVEKHAMNVNELGSVQKQIGEVDQLKDLTDQINDPNALKQQAVEKVQEQAVNHFEGHEQELQQAMELISNYKKKYGSFQNLEELTKKRQNEMRGKPLIERLLPGIAIQLQQRDMWLFDFNPYLGYKFNGRLTVGAGWNQRVAYNFDLNAFHPEFRIFGPRTFGEFKISEGLKAHLEAEYMKTTVPPIFSSGKTDPQGKEWVFSTMAGIKKDYRFFKSVRGTAMVLYNLHDPRHRSPYADRLIMRFGFEFPMRKKEGKELPVETN